MFRIAVVEDDMIMRKLLHRTLTSAGYECLLAVNAALGRLVCSREKPDLVLLDVNLPDEDGISLCRKLKADERLRHIPVLFLTGEAFGLQSRIDGLEAGGEDYVVKPFSLQELLSRIRGILRVSTRPTLA